MKLNWPTENEWDEESGMIKERRLTVLEIVLRVILDPLFAIWGWICGVLAPEIETIFVWILESFTNTIRFLDKKYSRGKDKKEPIPAVSTKELHDLLERILTLIESVQGQKIKRVLISSERVLHLFDYSKLPVTMYGYPVDFIGFDNADFALEVESGAYLTPMDRDYSEPLARTGVRRPKVREVIR